MYDPISPLLTVLLKFLLLKPTLWPGEHRLWSIIRPCLNTSSIFTTICNTDMLPSLSVAWQLGLPSINGHSRLQVQRQSLGRLHQTAWMASLTTRNYRYKSKNEIIIGPRAVLGYSTTDCGKASRRGFRAPSDYNCTPNRRVEFHWWWCSGSGKISGA